MAFINIENILTNKAEQDKIKEILWANETPEPCRDCGVKPGKKHKTGCDACNCEGCGRQAIQCKCPNGATIPTYDGYWPGVKYCYEKNLICWDTATAQWMWDLNRAAVERFKEIKLKKLN